MEPTTRIFFMADTHFGHRNISDYCQRPFGDIGEDDERLVASWNENVGSGDTIYFAGHFAHAHDVGRMTTIVNWLNGHAHLGRGNKDSAATLELPWLSVSERMVLPCRNRQLVSDHYLNRSWRGSSRSATRLHGHVHGTLHDLWNACDVGGDRWNFSPVTLKRIERRLAKTAHPELGSRARRR